MSEPTRLKAAFLGAAVGAPILYIAARVGASASYAFFQQTGLSDSLSELIGTLSNPVIPGLGFVSGAIAACLILNILFESSRIRPLSFFASSGITAVAAANAISFAID